MLESSVKQPPRRSNEHLTEDEKGLIFSSWTIGRGVRATAKAVNCSQRCVEKYFAQFRMAHGPKPGSKEYKHVVRSVPISVSTSTQHNHFSRITLPTRVVEPEFQLRAR